MESIYISQKLVTFGTKKVYLYANLVCKFDDVAETELQSQIHSRAGADT